MIIFHVQTLSRVAVDKEEEFVFQLVLTILVQRKV